MTWNRAEDLGRLLMDLSAQSEPPEEVIVVDNGSTDDSRRMVERDFPSVRLIALGRNTGLSQGRNVGIEAAAGDWIAILDNDLRLPDPDFWMKARTSIASHGDCGAITFHLFQGVWAPIGAGGQATVQPLSALEQMGRERCLPVAASAYYDWFLWGGCCLVSRRTFDVVGLFDPFFAYGGEEWDFAYRCHAAGVRLLRDTSLWAVHAQSPRMRSTEAPLLILQNMLVAQARYMPALDTALFLGLQVAKSAMQAVRAGSGHAFLRMLGRLARAWRPQVVARRRVVRRAVMQRFYYLRLNRPTDFREVEAATTSPWQFYLARARGATPEQADASCLALMRQ